jgi:hypothetical protein
MMFGRLYETWGESMIDSRWLYKIKHDVDGSIKKYKVRFIARGFSHKKGVNYDETLGVHDGGLYRLLIDHVALV